MSVNCVRRLLKEYKSIQAHPPPYLTARPEDDNIQLWYFVLEGPPDSPYDGGMYLGKLRFPDEYPFAPPSIMMCTPSGRFKTETRLCLSMSDFHPKEWNPSWGPESILKGLLSFMLEDTQTYGSIETSKEYKQQLAKETHAFNMKHPVFGRLFADQKAKCEERLAEIRKQRGSPSSHSSSLGAEGHPEGGALAVPQGKAALLRILQLVFVGLVAAATAYIYGQATAGRDS